MSGRAGTGWRADGRRTKVALWRHHPRRDVTAPALVTATRALDRRLEGDLIKLTPAGTWQAAAFGLTDCWRPDPVGLRTILHRPVAAVSDWVGIGWAAAAAPWHPREQAVLKATADMAATRTRPVPLLTTLFAPATVLAQLAPADVLARHLAEAPEAVIAALGAVAGRAVRLVAAIAAAGADGVYLAAKHRGHGRWPLPAGAAGDRLAAAIDDTDRRVMAAADGLGFNMLHLHEADAAAWWPLPAGAARWAVHLDQAVLEALPAQALAGALPAVGLDHRLIGRGGRDLAAVVDRLRAGPGAGGMILASACVLPLSVDLRAAARMMRQLRRVAT